jgi:DNA-binding transcriptional LysR family regulator
VEISMTGNRKLLGNVETFVAVVKAGSFRGAARALDLTPSGVSRAILRLEEQLAVRLFNRHARAVSLTDEGQRFHEDVRPLLSGLADAAEAARDASGVVTGILRVQADPPFGHGVLAPRLAEFLDANPSVRIELCIRDRIGDLVAESIDLALRFGETEVSSLIVRKLGCTEVLTCAAPSYLAAHSAPKTPFDLVGGRHRCILFRFPASGRLSEWEYRINGAWRSVPITGRLVVTDSPSLLRACVSGHGIAQLLGIYAREALDSGRIVRLLPEWSDERYPLYAYLPSRRHPPAKVRAFLNFVTDLVGSEVTLR